jgi:hypothetical protein
MGLTGGLNAISGGPRRTLGRPNVDFGPILNRRPPPTRKADTPELLKTPVCAELVKTRDWLSFGGVG